MGEPLLGWLAPYLNAPIDVIRGLVAGSEDSPWAKTGVLLGAGGGVLLSSLGRPQEAR